MSVARFVVFVLAIAFAGLSGTGVARAADVDGVNNTPTTALLLPSGQLIVNDSLNGAEGRLDTLLGQFDPAYLTLGLSDDNGSLLGNGKASGLQGVAFRSNGSAYFRVSAVADSGLIGEHTQSGKYYVVFDIFDAAHNFITRTVEPRDSLAPGEVDNVWIDPNPAYIGGTVDVNIENIVGPGTGDSLDFFRFAGLAPFQPFSAQITAADFAIGLGLVNLDGTITQGTSAGPFPLLTGVARGDGSVVLGVTGASDTMFKGEHAEMGNYTLQLTIVPEPGSVVLLAMGAFMAAIAVRQRAAARRAI